MLEAFISQWKAKPLTVLIEYGCHLFLSLKIQWQNRLQVSIGGFPFSSLTIKKSNFSEWIAAIPDGVVLSPLPVGLSKAVGISATRTGYSPYLAVIQFRLDLSKIFCKYFFPTLSVTINSILYLLFNCILFVFGPPPVSNLRVTPSVVVPSKCDPSVCIPLEVQSPLCLFPLKCGIHRRETCV